MEPGTIGVVIVYENRWAVPFVRAAQPPPPPPAAPAPAPAMAPAQSDLVAQLTDLAGLRDQGILTEEEFAAQKAKILGS